MPPCAKGVEASRPSGEATSRVTGNGVRRRAVASPAMPPPTTMTRSWTVAYCGWAVPTRRASAHGEHALDGKPRLLGHGRIDGHLMPPLFEGLPDLGQGDAFHVRAKIAGPHEFDFRVERGHIVAHRTFGDQGDPGGPLLADEFSHTCG